MRPRMGPWALFFDTFDDAAGPRWWLEDLRHPEGPWVPMKDEATGQRVAAERNAAVRDGAA